MIEIIKNEIKDSIELRNQLINDSYFIKKITSTAMTIIKALSAGNKVIFAGNGGSFADAQHLTAELTGRFLKERKPLAALCLGTNSSATTCISNDYDFSEIFAREFTALAKKGDILVVLSTSGNSENIVKLVEIAKNKDIDTFCLLGKDGGKLAKHPNSLIVPSYNTARIQEIHITIGHILCLLIDEGETL